MVHPEDRIVTVYRLSPDGTYGKADIFACEDLLLDVAVFPGLAIDFNAVFPPVPKNESPGPFDPPPSTQP